jgi:hypothetical protein
MDAVKRVQHLLLQELHHRVKNMLMTVIGITSQSLRSAQNLEEGRLAVESRLAALGRAHDLLLESNRAGAKLSEVIHDAIEPFDIHDVRRFVVQDTPIEIASEAVLPLTMSLNELCTNAVKYGALSTAAPASQTRLPRRLCSIRRKTSPVEVLIYLLSSRYCETDRLSNLAWSLFGQHQKGWPLVQAICDYVHDHITFGYAHASPGIRCLHRTERCVP